jgi:hypothetical protein
MAEEASIVQDGIDRFRDAFGNIEDEVERIQKQLRIRRRKIEKQLNTNRRDFEKRVESGRKDFEKRTRRLRAEVRKNPTFKRLEGIRKDASQRYEEGVETLLGALQIASKGDLQRIDRKISQLSKKLKEMERTRKANGRPAASD